MIFAGFASLLMPVCQQASKDKPFPTPTLRRDGKEREYGERNFRPAIAFAIAEFCFLLRKKRRRKEYCLAPNYPCAGNDKKLPNFRLLKLILFGSITIGLITAFITILQNFVY